MRDLTLLCVTKSEDYSTPFLEHFRDVAKTLDAKYMFAIDDAEAYNRGRQIKSPDGLWVPVKSHGFIESVLDEALSYCDSRYIFRIDDDEKFSPSLIEWLKTGAYTAADHWKFPRVHLWGDTEHFINAAPLYPDHQTRLSIREKSGGRTTVHAGSPYGGGQLCPHPIEHHKFLVKSRVDRMGIAMQYEVIQPGAGSGSMHAFNTPEDVYEPIPIEAYPNMAKVYSALETAWQIGMHQHEQEIGPFAMWLESRKPHNVLEIGTLKGGTAALWHGIATGSVVSIDLPDGRFGGKDHGYGEQQARNRNEELRRRFPRFTSALGDSHSPVMFEEVCRFFHPQMVDFLFIDGDHTYEGVKQDFMMYRTLVRKGGIIAFHDINDTPLHRVAGCRVDQLWNELPQHKAEFNIHADWGGIGVTFR
jgi:predicted O-methyltransferase YrrM